MALMGCSSEESADLVGRKIWYYVCARLEFISDALDMVRLHHAEHYLLVDSERDIYLRSFHYCGPVLVADGVPEFYADAHYVERVLVFDAAEVDHEHVAEVKTQDGSIIVFGIEVYDVAVSYP